MTITGSRSRLNSASTVTIYRQPFSTETTELPQPGALWRATISALTSITMRHGSRRECIGISYLRQDPRFGRGYVLAPRDLANALRREEAGNAEALGRLNLAAAAAALRDTSQVERTRLAVARERNRWNEVLAALRLKHTDAQGSFVFFDAGRPQPVLASALRKTGIEIGRGYPPYTNWARVTIGLPAENTRVHEALRSIFQS